MKFDPDLMRDILLEIESIPAGQRVGRVYYEDRDQMEVNRHVAILIDEGFIEGLWRGNGSNHPTLFNLTDLTYQGHQFLANARQKTLWNRALESLKSSGASMSISVITATVQKFAMQQAGLDE